MSIDHILGILVLFGAYGLTWYLFLKSKRIVHDLAEQDSEHASETEPELKPEHEAGSEA